MDSAGEVECVWDCLPPEMWTLIFGYLDAASLAKASCVNSEWNFFASQESLWEKLFYYEWGIVRPLSDEKRSWRAEYERLFSTTPAVETERLTEHKDEVLHIAFDEDGTQLASCSKDCRVLVWCFEPVFDQFWGPVSIKHDINLESYFFAYPQFSKFNKSGDILLVSGLTKNDYGVVAVIGIASREYVIHTVANTCSFCSTWFNDRNFLRFRMDPYQCEGRRGTLLFHDGVFGASYKTLYFDDKRCDFLVLAPDTLHKHQKLLIYGTGSHVIINPHILCFKRIPDPLLPTQSLQYTDPDFSIDLKASLLGVALAPDGRTLFVNCRPWIPGSVHRYSPRLSTEVELHEIDITTFSELAVMSGHKGFSSDSCPFLLHLDVRDQKTTLSTSLTDILELAWLSCRTKTS